MYISNLIHLKIIMFCYYVEKFKMYKLCIKCTDFFPVGNLPGTLRSRKV